MSRTHCVAWSVAGFVLNNRIVLAPVSLMRGRSEEGQSGVLAITMKSVPRSHRARNQPLEGPATGSLRGGLGDADRLLRKGEKSNSKECRQHFKKTKKMTRTDQQSPNHRRGPSQSKQTGSGMSAQSPPTDDGAPHFARASGDMSTSVIQVTKWRGLVVETLHDELSAVHKQSQVLNGQRWWRSRARARRDGDHKPDQGQEERHSRTAHVSVQSRHEGLLRGMPPSGMASLHIRRRQ